MKSKDDARKREILQQVRQVPGMNLRQVQRYTGLPLSTTARFLNELEEEAQVESTVNGSYRRFFPVGGGLHPRERVVLGHLSKPRPRSILENLLENPGTRHGDLADAVGLPAPTLTYYMKQILADDLVNIRKVGVNRIYRLKNPKMVRKALRRTAKYFDPVVAKG